MCRKIIFYDYSDKIRYNKKDNDNNDTKLEETLKCYLATNQPIANYNDELIKKIYCTVFKISNGPPWKINNVNFSELPLAV